MINGPAEPSGMDGDSDAAMQEVYAWFEKWSAAGKIADGGAELDAVSKSKTIRGAGGKTVVTDGPYLELKEVVGGVVFLSASSIHEAVEVASSWPGLQYPGVSVEVRPVIEHNM
jgi:hypothetical protein